MTSDAHELSWQGHRGARLGGASGFDVVDCVACGFRHVVPIPTPEELTEVYRHDYYQREKPLYLERHRQDLDWWRLVYRERLEAMEAAAGGRRGRILDVGSGPGFFLATARDRGWDALGLEPSARAAAHSRDELGLDIVEAFLSEELVPSLGRFDAVHCCNVLEHVPDPAAMVRTVASLLGPGGVAMLIAPNDWNPIQRALAEHLGFASWWVAPPHHINYFDFDSLARLVERSGLEVASRTTSFPIDLFLMMGDDYVGNDEVGRACHGRRMSLEKSLDAAGLGELKRRLYRAFSDLGLGREVVLLARAPG